MIKQMNNLTINRLKEISRECYEILYNCTEALEKTTKEKFNIEHKLTRENFENFLEKISSNNNIVDVEDWLTKILREIKEIFKDDIDMIFPFYQLCDIQIEEGVDWTLDVIIKIDYNYMGEIKHYNDIIPLDKNIKKHISGFEAYLNLLRVI